MQPPERRTRPRKRRHAHWMWFPTADPTMTALHLHRHYCVFGMHADGFRETAHNRRPCIRR